MRLYLDTSLLRATAIADLPLDDHGTGFCPGVAGAPRRDRTGGIPGSLAAEDFETAARLCLAQVPPLRAGDALHLALCQRLNLQLASIDLGLCKAAAHHQVAHQLLVI